MLLEDNQDDFSFEKPTTIDTESLETVLDMFYEDYLSKNPQSAPPVPKIPIGLGNPIPQRAKVYPNSEILKILQRVLEAAFKNTQSYEITAATLENSRLFFTVQLSPEYIPKISKASWDSSPI